MEQYHKPMDGFYNYTPELAFKEIRRNWKKWDGEVKPSCYVVGISGGVDSSCVAGLATAIFGKEKVVGVSMPCHGQSDMWAVDKVFEHLEIARLEVNIGSMFDAAVGQLHRNGISPTEVCTTNLPARIRMTMLYAVAQSVGGIVLNTCNRSESVVGNDTLFGDDCGSYAPIQKLTKTEVRGVAEFIGLPNELVEKTPIDGLQPLSDEERLGVTYDTIDAYIRSTGPVSDKDKAHIEDLLYRNLFKLRMIHIDGPGFAHYPDHVRAEFRV